LSGGHTEDNPLPVAWPPDKWEDVPDGTGTSLPQPDDAEGV
jgi:hypothetical protein